MNKYSIFIRYCGVDNIYVAEVQELEGCMAHGDTPDEAVKEIQIAMKLWLEAAKEEGMTIPEPIAYEAMAG
jgi:predicted RNase H-like HicB family nuclease